MAEENLIKPAEESPDEEKRAKQSVELPVQHVRTADFQMPFCNIIQISPGRGEIQLFFARVLTPPSGNEMPEKLIAEQFFGVAITIDHAKRVADLLTRQIKAAEEIAAKNS